MMLATFRYHRGRNIVTAACIGMLLSGALRAAPVDERDVSNAVLTFVSLRYPSLYQAGVRSVTAVGPSAMALERIERLYDIDTRTIGFVAHLAPAGFVLMRADDEVPPLKLYSADSAFHNLPPWAIEAVRQELAAELDTLADARSQRQTLPHTYTEHWRELRAGTTRVPTGIQQYSVQAVLAGPLLTTGWDQGDPYNLHMPTASGTPNGYAGRTPVGCGATALAQILRYHQKPAAIARDETYSDSSGTCRGTHSASKAGLGNYAWSSMPNTVSSSSSSAQKNAVAQLIWHCAVGVHMDFEADGSSSSTSGAESALRNLFNYTCDNYVRRSSYNDSQWFAKITSDINAKKPIDYVLNGHMVVCDGVSGSDQIHLNFGWGTFSPGSTAWYSMNKINESHGPWTTQGAIFNITPPSGGSAPSVTSFSINNGAASTASRTVTLNNSCAGGPTHYMASESSSFSGAAWQTYSTAPSFTLSTGNGAKTVYFKVKNTFGESGVKSAKITLNESTGTTPSVTAFSINNGAAATTTRSVTLNNTCSGAPTEYMASESSSFAGATWNAYSTAPGFTLSAGNGTKTVYFKVKNAYGTSATRSDTITLNESTGTAPSITAFNINNGAAATTTRSVTLNNTCSGAPTEYMASESSSFAGATWKAYSTAPGFTLSTGNGTKTVYFKVKNAYGTSATRSDSITLNEGGGYAALDVLKMKERINWKKGDVGTGMVKVGMPTTLTGLGSLFTSYAAVMCISPNGTQWLNCSSGDFIRMNKKRTMVRYTTKNGKYKVVTTVQLKKGYITVTRTHANATNREFGYGLSKVDTGGQLQKKITTRLELNVVKGTGTYNIKYKTKGGKFSVVK